MIKGIGIDLAEISRIETISLEHDGFTQKVLTTAETAEYLSFSEKRRVEYLADRFSAKEAFSKAMGSGIGKKVSFQDVSILDDDAGKPHIFTQLTKDKIHISISHTDNLVMTEVIIEEL